MLTASRICVLIPMALPPELPFTQHPPTLGGAVYNVYKHQLSGEVMSSTVLSFRVDGDTANKLDQLAQATERDRQYHLKRALDQYLEAEIWHLQAIAEGIADADAGKLTELERVRERWVARAENSAD